MEKGLLLSHEGDSSKLDDGNEKKPNKTKMFDDLHTKKPKKPGANMTVLKYAQYILLFSFDQDLPKIKR